MAEGQTYPTWKAAAVAEAIRLNPALRHPEADRVHVRGSGPRMRVRGDGGYCHLFGGLNVLRGDGRRWVANDITECGNLPLR